MVKIIVRLDTDNQMLINKFREEWERNDTVFVPAGEEIEIWVIDDKGNSTLLERRESK